MFSSILIKWVMHVARIVERKTNELGLVRKPEETRPFGGPSNRWDDIIKFVCKEIS